MASAVAVARQKKVVPAFTVTELEGSRKRQFKVFDKEKKTFEDKEEDVEGGYRLTFPKGHSIVVDSMDEVRRLVGDPEQVELVNLETSDIHGVATIPVKKGR